MGSLFFVIPYRKSFQCLLIIFTILQRPTVWFCENACTVRKKARTRRQKRKSCERLSFDYLLSWATDGDWWVLAVLLWVSAEAGWRNFNSKLLQNTSQYFLYLIFAPGEKYLGELKVCCTNSRSSGTFISLLWRGGLFSVVFWGRAFVTSLPPQNDCHSKHHIENSCQRLLESLSYFSFEHGSPFLLWRRAVTFLQC